MLLNIRISLINIREYDAYIIIKRVYVIIFVSLKLSMHFSGLIICNRKGIICKLSVFLMER